MTERWRAIWLVGLASLSMAGIGGCQAQSSPEVVVYCALDRGFSEPILQQFERDTGIKVKPVYDTESTKSVGLRERIVNEASRPRCDLFWNNEILNTLRLEREQLLAGYASPVGNEYPESCRSPAGTWYGFAARARVLIVNTEKEPDPPKTLEELTDPKWRGRLAIAKPLFGTTATHVASLFAIWGPEKTKDWLRRLKENDVQILAGNKQVALQVGAGSIAMGLTDTDDALAEIAAGRPVKMVFIETDQQNPGIFIIPNVVSLIRGGPNPEQAQKLLDYLLSPKVEERLATGESGQIPLHPGVQAAPQLGTPEESAPLPVDFPEAFKHWDEAMSFVKDEFTAP